MDDKTVTRQAIAQNGARHGHHVHGGHSHAHAECAHGLRQQTAGGKAIAEAVDACARSGVRLTKIRRRVLEALYATHRPLGAYDVAAAMADGGRPTAPVTVYRALEFLMEQGLVHRLATRNAFVACPHQHTNDDLVVFLICDQCGGVDETSSDDVRFALDTLAKNVGFAPQSRVIELAGRCEHCRTA